MIHPIPGSVIETLPPETPKVTYKQVSKYYFFAARKYRLNLVFDRKKLQFFEWSMF